MQVAECFGRILKVVRNQKEISQEELADRTGLDRTFISLLERGERQPSLTSILLLAHALETSASYLITQVEDQLRETEQSRNTD